MPHAWRSFAIGKQTDAGRKRISDAVRKRMRAFWEDWRKAGKPPLPWRESLRTARAKPKKLTPPTKPALKPMRPLTREEIEFGRKTGMLKR